MKMECHFQRVVLIWLSFFSVSVDLQDPCEAGNHQPFPQNSFGSRNEICDPKVSPTCDYYLKENWYVAENSTILNHCPMKGNCGVAYPTWMQGGFPRIQDGEVNQTACIKMEGDCCMMNVTMTIKNCTDFFVFNLPPLPACPMAYCFKSAMPCDPPTTTTVGTTRSLGGGTSTGKFHTTTNIQKGGETAPKDGPSETSSTLLIALCSGILALLIVAGVFCGWMWATGRCSRHLSPVSTQTAVSPEILSVSYEKKPPPAYSEK